VRVADPTADATGATSAPAAEVPHRDRRRPAWNVAGSTAFVIAATMLQPLRQAGTPMWRTVWAEDAAVFYETALQEPLHEVIFRGYAGYGHVIPRLLAAVGAQLPPERYSQFVTFSSALVVALLALFVYWASGPLLRSPVRQGVLASAVFLLPILPHEVVGAICNIHWFVPLACLLAVLVPVTRPWSIAVRLAIVVLAPLSSPLCVLFVPIALWHVVRVVWRRADVRTVIVPVGLVLASAGQVLIWMSSEAPSADRPPVGELAEQLARLYGTKVTLGTFFGVPVTEWLWDWAGYLVAIGVLVALVAALAWKVSRATPTSRLLLIGAVVASIGVYAFSIAQRPELIDVVMVESGESYNFIAMRYEILPALLLLVALLVPVDLESGALTHPVVPVAPRAAGLIRRDGAVLVAAAIWLAVALIPSFRFTNGRSDGPNWVHEVYRARAECQLAEAEQTPSGDDPPPDEVRVGASPPGPGWGAAVDCDDVAWHRPPDPETPTATENVD
jgi:hypothetical protein